MSSRVTRSAARLAADSSASSPISPPLPPTAAAVPQTTTRKRKVAARPDSSPEAAPPKRTSVRTQRSSKRQKTTDTAAETPTAPPQPSRAARGKRTKGTNNTMSGARSVEQGLGWRGDANWYSAHPLMRPMRLQKLLHPPHHVPDLTRTKRALKVKRNHFHAAFLYSRVDRYIASSPTLHRSTEEAAFKKR